MDCPKCAQPMKKVSWSISKNTQPDPPKEYDRTLYQCEVDDSWVTTEIPRI